MQPISKKNNLYIGTLSGTSMDSIDATLLKITNKIKVINSYSVKMPKTLSNKMMELSKMKKNLFLHPTKELREADEEFTFETVNVVRKLLKKSKLRNSDIHALGSHGQTIQHRPFSKKPYSLQIGNPKIISNLTGITTIGNFRQTNITNGGSGAPLTPSFHNFFLRDKAKNRAIINIGGITNITLLLKNKKTIGWDTGPGNCLIDQSVKKLIGGKFLFDKNGDFARKGDFKKVRKTIDLVIKKPFFNIEIPKSDSTENYDFSKLFFKNSNLSKFDWISAMTEITALTLVNSLVKNCSSKKLNIYICGGGSKNSYLIKRIKTKLPRNWSIGNTKTLGIDPMFVETSTFGWLAKQRLENKKIDLKSSTGAIPSLTGEVFQA